jgi:ubiquinone/menaquinone biosynthesis C-methylase UbiE
MGFYQDHALPILINLAMRQKRLAPYRNRVVSSAEGRVLEIGIGSGLNLPFYGSSVQSVIGVDPSAKLLAMSRRRDRKESHTLELVEVSAEELPFESGSMDTVVSTWTLCSIPDAGRSLREVRRVLKPAGRLLFVEHGRAPELNVRKWQDRLTPLWKRVSGGCHLNRTIDVLVEHAGFRLERLDRGYMPGPKTMTFMYEGSARPA